MGGTPTSSFSPSFSPFFSLFFLLWLAHHKKKPSQGLHRLCCNFILWVELKANDMRQSEELLEPCWEVHWELGEHIGNLGNTLGTTKVQHPNPPNPKEIYIYIYIYEPDECMLPHLIGCKNLFCVCVFFAIFGLF